MQTLRKAILAGAAAGLLCGAFSAAAANGQDTHVLTIRLPGGAMEHIRYAGDVAPRVAIDPQTVPDSFGWAPGNFDPAPFAAFDRLSAEMDRQMADMIRRTKALAGQPFPNAQEPTTVAAGKLPADSESYSFVSANGGNVFCARSVEITSPGNAQKPRVVSRTYGNCANEGPAMGSAAHSRADSAGQPDGAGAIGYAAPTSDGTLREISDVR